MIPRFVWLASYPKSGNTWLRVFLSNLTEGTKTPADINSLRHNASSCTRKIFDDVLGFDTGDFSSEDVMRLRPIVYRWMNGRLSEPVYFKAHDACERLSNGDWLMAPDVTDRVVYIVRNPLDVAVSFAHHSSIPINEAIKAMRYESSSMSPQTSKGLQTQLEQPIGTWSHHVESWTQNPLFKTCAIRYEDMNAAPEATFAKITEFLGLPHDAAQRDQAIRNSSFEVLQEQEATAKFRERPQNATKFFRNGKVGSWKDVLSPDQIDEVVSDHGSVMQKFGYIDRNGTPLLA